MTTGAESEGMFINSTIKDIQYKTSKLGTKFYFSTREVKYSYAKISQCRATTQSSCQRRLNSIPQTISIY